MSHSRITSAGLKRHHFLYNMWLSALFILHRCKFLKNPLAAQFTLSNDHTADFWEVLNVCALGAQHPPWMQILKSQLWRRGGGLGSSTIFKKFNEPYARRKWYLTTGRRAHQMVLDPIPQSLPVHFFGSLPQFPTSPLKSLNAVDLVKGGEDS